MEENLLELQEELPKVEKERRQAREELEEIKLRMSSEESQKNAKARIEMLESELDEAKESERRMLESLTCQTKQLEQTKILLEEAKLEIRSLNATIQSIESSTVDVQDGAEVSALRTELKLALAAEEKSKKALDDLAMVLKEVTTESSSLKEKLCQTQCELENARGEAERVKVTLRRVEAKLRATAEEAKRLKEEADESSAAWHVKETGFLDCMKMCEDEIASLRQENGQLAEAHMAARDETSKLRDIMKQAISEASVVKEALEITRRENTQLMDMIAAKNSSIEALAQELLSIKTSEAAALDSVKGLQSLLVVSPPIDLSPRVVPATTTTTMEVVVAATATATATTTTVEVAATETETATTKTTRKKMIKYPSENWRHERPRLQKARRRSLGDSDGLEVLIFDMLESPKERKAEEDIMNGENNGNGNGIERKESVNGVENAWDSPARQKLKKRQILRRFGDMLRRSIHT